MHQILLKKATFSTLLHRVPTAQCTARAIARELSWICTANHRLYVTCVFPPQVACDAKYVCDQENRTAPELVHCAAMLPWLHAREGWAACTCTLVHVHYCAFTMHPVKSVQDLNFKLDNQTKVHLGCMHVMAGLACTCTLVHVHLPCTQQSQFNI